MTSSACTIYLVRAYNVWRNWRFRPPPSAQQSIHQMQFHLRHIAPLLLAVAMTGVSAQQLVTIFPPAAASAPASSLAAVPVPLTQVAKEQPWAIERGERIDLALQRWAAKAGWTLSWVPMVSWECPARVEFNGDFSNVAIQVIEALNQDGKRLRLRIFDSGRFMEVVSDAAL